MATPKETKRSSCFFVTLGQKLPGTLWITDLTWSFNMNLCLWSSMLALLNHRTFLLILMFLYMMLLLHEMALQEAINLHPSLSCSFHPWLHIRIVWRFQTKPMARSHPRLIKSESLEVGPRHQSAFLKLPGDCGASKVKNHWFKASILYYKQKKSYS